MKPITDEQRSAIAQKLREIADILEPTAIAAQSDGPEIPGGGNGNGPPGSGNTGN